jgi:signal peptidase I
MPAAKAEASVDFVQMLLAREGGAWVRAASSSMSPLIRRGDQLRLGALEPGRVRAGTIVAFRRDGALIVHRVLGEKPAGLVTKGDALVDADEPISTRELLARVAAIRSPGGRSIDLDRRPWPWIGAVLATVARICGANPFAWKVCRIPFYLAAVFGR